MGSGHGVTRQAKLGMTVMEAVLLIEGACTWYLDENYVIGDYEGWLVFETLTGSIDLIANVKD